MSFLDSIISNLMGSARRKASKTVNQAVNTTVNNVKKLANEKHEFTFEAIPATLSELQALPEASLDDPFKTTALAVLVLCLYEQDKKTMFEMLDFLNGPDDVSTYTKNFISERLDGKAYKAFSFFKGATPANSYKPEVPYKITVTSNPYSFKEENRAILYVQSSGADAPRGITLRKKPSTGQWFVNDIQILSDIRIPASEDEWA